MKKFSYLIILALIVTGCAYKNPPIAMGIYKAEYDGERVKQNTTVYLSSVKDIRQEKSTIGYVIVDSKKTLPLYNEENLEKVYKDGLIYALNVAGYNTNVSQSEASMVVDISIQDAKLVYNSNKTFDENLKGEITIQAKVRKGNKILTFNFKQKSGKWIKPSFDSKDLEPFLNQLYNDSINEIVAKLVTIVEKK